MCSSDLHQSVGAEMARRLLRGLCFPNSVVDEVAFLISMHLRVGEYDEQWSDAAVRRLLRDAGDRLGDLVELTRADKAAANPEIPSVDLDAFERRVAVVKSQLAGKMVSPLDGREISELLGIRPGPEVGAAKSYLENQIIEGLVVQVDGKERVARADLRDDTIGAHHPEALLLAWGAGSLPALGLAFALGGVYVGVEETLEDSLAAELVPARQRGAGFGLLSIVNGAGDFVSSVVTGWLWSVAGPAVAFGLAGLMMAAGAAGVAWSRPFADGARN